MINAVIIEDENIFANDLKTKLNKVAPEINIISTLTSGNESLNILPKLSFDLLFLDIELGDMTAFDLLGKVNIHNFHIIFVTSFEKYAIQAFKVNAIDYLLKPVDEKELRYAVSNAIKQIITDDLKNNLLFDYHLLRSKLICISETNSYVYIPYEKIIYCQSNGNYTEIHYEEDGTDKQETATKNLLYFEKKLAGYNFLRIHQSVLINTTQIRKIKKKNGEIVLRNGKSFTIARNRKKAIIDLLTNENPV